MIPIVARKQTRVIATYFERSEQAKASWSATVNLEFDNGALVESGGIGGEFDKAMNVDS